MGEAQRLGLLSGLRVGLVLGDGAHLAWMNMSSRAFGGE
jgi:hypothetical protein